MSDLSLDVSDLKSATLEAELGKLLDAELPGPGTPAEWLPSVETLDTLRAMASQAASLAKMHGLTGPAEIRFEVAPAGGMVSIRHGANVVTAQNLDLAQVRKAAETRKALARKVVAPAPATKALSPAIASSAKAGAPVVSAGPKPTAAALRR